MIGKMAAEGIGLKELGKLVDLNYTPVEKAEIPGLVSYIAAYHKWVAEGASR